MKVMVKSVSLYALMESSFFRCGLLLKSVTGQLQVGCQCLQADVYMWSCYTKCRAWNEGQQVKKDPCRDHNQIWDLYTHSLDSTTSATPPSHNPLYPIALSAAHRWGMKLQPIIQQTHAGKLALLYKQPLSRHMSWSLFCDSGLSVLPACCISPRVWDGCWYIVPLAM